MDASQSDVGQDARSSLLRRKHLRNERLRLDRSAEGVQREVGVNLPLGVVVTTTM